MEKNKFMKVSVIIPVYNAEKYLEECINSALSQTYRDLEIIAVNDGSTDNSLAKLEKYSGKIKIISKSNGGAASALNVGIRAATGEWIKWLNADDILYPDAIEQLLNEAKKLDDKTNIILYANHDFIDSEGRIIGRKFEPNYNDLNSFDFNVMLLDHFIGNQDTVLMHRTTIDNYGMFDEKLGQEDYELHLRYCLIHHCRLRLVDKFVAKYRIHETQISRANVRKPDYANKIRDQVLGNLDVTEQERYRNALIKYRQNRPFKKKMLQTLGKTGLRFLPFSISNRVAITYLKFIAKNKNPNINQT
jgi:glycosyltransferase involved in cell wall biosynthesis